MKTILFLVFLLVKSEIKTDECFTWPKPENRQTLNGTSGFVVMRAAPIATPKLIEFLWIQRDGERARPVFWLGSSVFAKQMTSFSHGFAFNTHDNRRQQQKQNTEIIIIILYIEVIEHGRLTKHTVPLQLRRALLQRVCN